MITIRVPATSANMGPGFDSLGIAVQLYLEIDILEEADEWEIEHDIPFLPTNERNLIIQTALKVSHQLKPHRLKMRNDIPTTRGLGSSSSAIVAGIELANILADLNLSVDDKIQLANRFEGHPDNIAPAIVGNCVVSAQVNKRVFWSKLYLKQMALVACVPDKPLSTKESRGVLPKALSLTKAAEGSAIGNVVVAQLARGQYKYMRRLIERDVFHEPYRKHLVPELTKIRTLLKKQFVYGTYLSGAGPTVMTLVPMNKAIMVQQQLQQAFPQHTILNLKVDSEGVRVIHEGK